MTEYGTTHEAGDTRTTRGTRVSPGDTTSRTWQAEDTRREAITQGLMEVGRYLSEHPEARKNLKPIRSSKKLQPGVYYNLGTGMVDRVYRPQRVALGHNMFRISGDPGAPVEEVRRGVMGGE